jgi:threonine synthase
MYSKPIKYYSTNGKSGIVSFREALMKGLASDGGLFMPDSIPELSESEREELRGKEYHEIAAHVINKFTWNELTEDILSDLCREAYNFEVPLEKVSGRKYILRLDRGPTASFKDFAARMMSRMMQYFLSVTNNRLTILTATSGDTGSAVASAFYGLKNIDVIILFPINEVTGIQRKQMSTLNENISVVAVNGKFDDCQKMVKKAFRDPLLTHLPLSSANSINIGRLIPQAVYYFYSWLKLSDNKDDKAFFSVPSGNFGNLTAGLLAKRMGLPVAKFIVATNANNEVPEFLRTHRYIPVVPSKNCLSSAMNVGHPSNLARMIDLYGGRMNETGTIISEPDMNTMCTDLYGISITDEETKDTIAETYRESGILLEPHGAIAWKGINEYLKNEKNSGSEIFISLETAHPAKFPEEMKRIMNIDPPLPLSLSMLEDKNENYITIENNYQELKDMIIRHS